MPAVPVRFLTSTRAPKLVTLHNTRSIRSRASPSLFNPVCDEGYALRGMCSTMMTNLIRLPGVHISEITARR